MNKNHVVFHGSVNSAFLSAAAHAGGGVHEAGLQLVTQTQAQRLVDLDRDLASMEAIEDAFRAIGGAFSLSEKNPGAR